MEILLCALTSMVLAVATVAVVSLGIALVLQENREEQVEQIQEEILNSSSMNSLYAGGPLYDPVPGKDEMSLEEEILYANGLAEPPRGMYYEEPQSIVSGWVIGGILLIFALFVVYFLLLTERFSRYLNEIADGIQEISAGNFDVEFPTRHEDELSVIAEGLNKMTGDIKFMMENERNMEYAKNELITNVAHDLRTPLTSIIGYLGLATGKADLDEETRRHYVEIAYDKSQRLERLIEDLFSFTKVSFGQIKLRKSLVDMVKLTEQLMEEFYPSIEDAGLELEFHTNEKQILREVDGDLMARAIANLISNAIKYGRDGKSLKVELEKTPKTLKLMVTNYGRMIPAEDLAHIFDKFYRVEASRSTDTGGSGLGLAITRNIVRMHDGIIRVKSDPEGTVFTATFYDDPEDNPEKVGDEDDE